MPIATQRTKKSLLISGNVCVCVHKCGAPGTAIINIISNIRSHVQTQIKSAGFKTPKFDHLDCFYYCHPTDTNGWLGS